MPSDAPAGLYVVIFIMSMPAFIFGFVIISECILCSRSKSKSNPTVECSKCGKTLPMSTSRAEDIYLYNHKLGDTVLKYIRFYCKDC